MKRVKIGSGALGFKHGHLAVEDLEQSPTKSHQKLGTGNFGEVLEGLFRTTSIAIKLLKSNNSADRKDFLAEAELFKKLRYSGLFQTEK